MSSWGTRSLLVELVYQQLQSGLMLLGLETFATLVCLLAKPVLEILGGLLLLLRRDVAGWDAVQAETAASRRDGLEIGSGAGMALQGPAQGRLVDIGKRRRDCLVNADGQGLDVPEYGVSLD